MSSLALINTLLLRIIITIVKDFTSSVRSVGFQMTGKVHLIKSTIPLLAVNLKVVF